MYYYRVDYSSPYAGTYEVDFLALEEPLTFKDGRKIYDQCVETLLDSYGYLINGWCGEDPTEEQLDAFIESCDVSIDEITKEEYEEEVS